jgi:single-strand DNA-binding protein
MAGRSLNKVILIGNLTRDPELRYTPQGTPVCSFGMATNRSWMPAGGEERQEEVEFHNIVAWSKLAELCGELLAKGRKVYIEGRLQTRSWDSPEGEKKYKTEIIAEDMMILDSRGRDEGEGASAPSTSNRSRPAERPAPSEVLDQSINPDEIPF